ncbi:ARM repeat-containing protein [Obba rivulosa]|uniref:ARM repeat-containing protein n=1 Tax=Obba rivulosa TaxID=1052685 RepID=A0A8E2DH65_9APHY|nr:ARM repeat-containing protein [Obba rivulosa]
MTDSIESDLDVILKSSQDKSHELTSSELYTVTHSFLPTCPQSVRTKAYVVLSALCQRLRGDAGVDTNLQDDKGTHVVYRAFESVVTLLLSDSVEHEILAAISFLAALFEVDWRAAALIFQKDGVLEAITDALDLFDTSAYISQAVAHLFAQASGHKSCRAIISSEVGWLERKSRQTSDPVLRASAAVALVKLSKGMRADAMEVGGLQEKDSVSGDEELVRLMKGLIVEEHDTSSLGDAVEGLAYLSTDPRVKEMLADDSSFLSRLFSLVPRKKGASAATPDTPGTSPIFGTVVIITNLCAYKPHLSEEEAQMAKLRKMAKTPAGAAKSGQSDGEDPLEDDEHVRRRGQKLIASGALDALTAAVRATDSRAVRLAAGKALLNLIEDKDNRGKVLQAGGAKALMTIIRDLLPALSSTAQESKMLQLTGAEIEPIQALAKLAITASPVQVFGPNEDALYDAIRPFSVMLMHPSSNLLQRFEALMALTNLSSQSAEAGTRIARVDRLLNKVELLMLEDHILVRRAATELMCNLVAGSEEVFNRYGGEKTSAAKSKLQVLVAMCDVDDLPTRLAASGALATLAAHPTACQNLLELQRERGRVLPILGQLIDPSIIPPSDVVDDEGSLSSEAQPDPGLVHRGVVCIRNFFLNFEDPATQKEIAVEADRIGITRALVGVVKSSAGDSPVLRPTAEALKWLLSSGIAITG